MRNQKWQSEAIPWYLQPTLKSISQTILAFLPSNTPGCLEFPLIGLGGTHTHKIAVFLPGKCTIKRVSWGYGIRIMSCLGRQIISHVLNEMFTWNAHNETLLLLEFPSVNWCPDSQAMTRIWKTHLQVTSDPFSQCLFYFRRPNSKIELNKSSYWAKTYLRPFQLWSAWRKEDTPSPLWWPPLHQLLLPFYNYSQISHVIRSYQRTAYIYTWSYLAILTSDQTVGSDSMFSEVKGRTPLSSVAICSGHYWRVCYSI